MILLIDNYDSFVHNLARYFAEIGCATTVVRNDEISVADIAAMHPQALVLSPGPCTPAEAGVCIEAVQKLGAYLPVLGVCLGHQAIAAALGGRIAQAAEPVHGRTSLVEHTGSGLYEGLPNPLRVTRYHSLVVEESSLPETLDVTARTADGLVMAVEHREWPVFGVQFHPESVLTEGGRRLLANFLRLGGLEVAACPQDEFVASTPSLEWPSDDVSLGAPLHW